MIHKVWGGKGWRYNRWLWALAFLLIGGRQLMAGQPPSSTVPMLLFAVVCIGSAWRRSIVPLYVVTDDELLMSAGLFSKKQVLWRDIKEVKREGYWVRLIGHRAFGGTDLNLYRLAKSERDGFLQLVQSKVDHANGNPPEPTLPSDPL